MGSACCIAARDRTLSNGSRGEIVHRNVLYSPSWSFQWDSRRRVASEVENPSCGPSHVNSVESSMEMKRELGLDTGQFSGGGSSLENFGTPVSHKSSFHEGLAANPVTPPSDPIMVGNDNTKAKSSIESPEIVNYPEPSFSVPSSSSISPRIETSQPRRARYSPSNRISRQISDSRIIGLKSPNSNSVSEGTPSFVHSTCNNDPMTGSLCGSSDGWSMRTFSELVASSRRERWSFDSGFLGSSNRFSYSPCIDMRTCGACSKRLTERSSLKCDEISIVSVLVCGHLFHAECLENMTLEVDRYDPSCPICTVGEKQKLKSKSHKIYRNRVVSNYLDAGFNVLDRRKSLEQKGRVPKMEPSSSARSSFAKPFLRLGSKWSRSLSENESSRKKGFWGKYRKD